MSSEIARTAPTLPPTTAPVFAAAATVGAGEDGVSAALVWEGLCKELIVELRERVLVASAAVFTVSSLRLGEAEKAEHITSARRYSPQQLLAFRELVAFLCTPIRVPWHRVSREAAQAAKVAVVVEQVPSRVGALRVWEKRYRTVGCGGATVDIVLGGAKGAGGATRVIWVASLTALFLCCEAGAIPAEGEAGCHSGTMGRQDDGKTGLSLGSIRRRAGTLEQRRSLLFVSYTESIGGLPN